MFAKVNQLLNTPEVHKCVLYCGPSNKSVDVVFSKFVSLCVCLTWMRTNCLSLVSNSI